MSSSPNCLIPVWTVYRDKKKQKTTTTKKKTVQHNTNNKFDIPQSRSAKKNESILLPARLPIVKCTRLLQKCTQIYHVSEFVGESRLYFKIDYIFIPPAAQSEQNPISLQLINNSNV